MNKKRNESFQIITFLASAILAFVEFFKENVLKYVGKQNIWESRRFVVFLVFIFLSIIFFILVYKFDFLALLGKKRKDLFKIPRLLRVVLALVVVSFPALLKWIIPFPETIQLGNSVFMFLLYFSALFADWLISDRGDAYPAIVRVAFYFLLGGAINLIFSKLVYVTNFPFPLYWSEGNRFFDYSTLFGSFRYIVPNGGAINAFTTWGMQLPWSLPFVIPNITIGMFRFWNQLLWIFPSMFLGLLTFNIFKAERHEQIIPVVFALWTFLFFDQGPIYAPLLIAGVLTFIGLRLRLIPAAIFVMLASYYAYEARWTWSFAPGLWAGLASFLLIADPSFKKSKIKELVRPVLLGLAGLFGGRVLPFIINQIESILQNSGDAEIVSTITGLGRNIIPDVVAAASQHPLLWDRLLPNSTYSPGIMLGVIWATLPINLLILYLLIKKLWKPNWMQMLAVLIISIGFLVVGLIISTKIGGGSNLHNLDMYFVSLMVITAAALNNSNSLSKKILINNYTYAIILAIVMVMPISYSLQVENSINIHDDYEIERSLSVIEDNLNLFKDTGEILFIDHRQLLTFNLVTQVPLVDEYEKKMLMEMSMNPKPQYLMQFYKDLIEHRFSLIINEPINIIKRGNESDFAEENNAYVKSVSTPLLCFYEPIYTNLNTKVELLVPRVGLPPDYLPCEEYLP